MNQFDYSYTTPGFYDSPFVPLIIGFIGLIFLAHAADGMFKILNRFFTDKLFPRTKFLPNELSDEAAALLIIIILYHICLLGKFDFWAYINFAFPYPWGYVMTAFTAAGGTSELRSRFETMNLIPMSIGSGLTSTAARVVSAVKGVGNSGNNNT